MKKELQPLRKVFDRFTGRVDLFRVYSDFFAIAALEISAAVDATTKAARRSAAEEIRRRYSEDERDLFVQGYAELIRLFTDHGLYDWLGELYMEGGSSSSGAGQFFTPYHVSKLTAEPAAQRGIELLRGGETVITASEPACGSGGMVLALADLLAEKGVNYAERLYAECCDLDERCVHMAYVQLSLAGIPASVIRRNTLTMERFGAPWHTPGLVFNWLRFRKYVM